MPRFAPGESVLWRSILPEPLIVQTVWPWTVVADEGHEVVLYMPAGTVGKQRTGKRGGPGGRMMLRPDGGHQDVTWKRTNVLRLYRDGDGYSLWFAFDAATHDLAWRYINLEEPWRRTPVGFDSRDLYLDLVAGPDGDEWRWKDEDELDWVVREGRIDAARATAVRAEGERALARLRPVAAELLERWRTWRPDPSWTTPAVPADWRDHATTERS